MSIRGPSIVATGKPHSVVKCKNCKARPPAPGRTRCEKCQVAERQRAADRAARLDGEGLCRKCGQHAREKGRVYCADCARYFAHRDTIARVRREDPRLAEVLEMRRQGKTLQQIGNKFGLTRQRVQQLVADLPGSAKRLAEAGKAESQQRKQQERALAAITAKTEGVPTAFLRARLGAGIGILALARDTGVNHRTILRADRGERLAPKTRAILANAVGLHPDELGPAYIPPGGRRAPVDSTPHAP